MFNISAFQSKREIKTIRQGEPNFMINDGLISYPRAMIHIKPECPSAVRQQIEWAIVQGYVKTVAHVQGKELTWEKLNQE